MLEIINIDDLKNIEGIRQLWNDEVGFIFPISEFLFKKNVLECEYYCKKASFVAKDEDKVVGFIISKIYNNDPLIPAYIDSSWISLFYVSRNYRNKGIGSTLLKKAEDELMSLNVKKINIGRDINNFFPGIPSDFDNLTAPFLQKRGYECGGYTHDLIKYNISEIKQYIPKHNVRYLQESDYEETIKFFEKNFPGRWLVETKKALDKKCFNQYLVAFDGSKVIGFLRISYPTDEVFPYSQTWNNRFEKLGGVGPLGVDKDYRKQGIANDLLMYGFYQMKVNNITEAMIDWTGLMAIYQKYGFEVWKTYQYTNKTIL